MATHNETCACGATLSYIGNDPSAAARRFREGHNCSQPTPPGPCWHDSGVTWPSGERPRCELLAGHAGAHTCRSGHGESVWINVSTLSPTTDRSAS